jgi:hypothetical protein
MPKFELNDVKYKRQTRFFKGSVIKHNETSSVSIVIDTLISGKSDPSEALKTAKLHENCRLI